MAIIDDDFVLFGSSVKISVRVCVAMNLEKISRKFWSFALYWLINIIVCKDSSYVVLYHTRIYIFNHQSRSIVHCNSYVAPIYSMLVCKSEIRHIIFKICIQLQRKFYSSKCTYEVRIFTGSKYSLFEFM